MNITIYGWSTNVSGQQTAAVWASPARCPKPVVRSGVSTIYVGGLTDTGRRAYPIFNGGGYGVWRVPLL